MKTVLVTGASRGIGKAIALRFAREGYHVFINCRRSADKLEEVRHEIETLGARCTTLIADVADPARVREMFDAIYKETPHLDVCVNNAGISMVGLVTDLTDAEWNEMLQTNLSSAFYCSRAAIPGMLAVQSGSIINISSMWGTVGASCEVAYSTAKAGLNGFTKALSKELAPSNIAVNAIACGVTDTEMNGHLTPEERLELEYSIPMGRYASPEEIGELVWHVSQSPAYMTGQVIGIDGGFI